MEGYDTNLHFFKNIPLAVIYRMDFGTREKAGALVESNCRVQTRDDDGLY